MNAQTLTSLDQALQHLLQQVQPVSEKQSVALVEAEACILAQSVKAELDVPGHDNSAMDGFALHTDSINGKGTLLPVSQTIKAGAVGKALQPGTAARIFTGAPIPEGANTVVIQEDTEFDAQQVKVLELPRTGDNIRLQGHDIQIGSEVFNEGRRLLPQDIGLLASLGIASVTVYKPLKVAIINTGDELIEPGKKLRTGQIYESNSFTLISLLNRLGMLTQCFEIVKDELEATRKVLLEASDQADVIISSGGVSVGDADFVKTAVEELGELSLWKIALKPGKPFSYGRVNSTPFFGLPGNPVAVFVTFLVLVKPYLLRMQGVAACSPTSVHVPAGFERSRPGTRQEYLRVRLQKQADGSERLIAYENQGSSLMTSLSWADGLAVIPVNTVLKEGDLVEYLPFSGLL